MEDKDEKWGERETLCVCVCVCACVHACVCVCVRVCVCLHTVLNLPVHHKCVPTPPLRFCQIWDILSGSLQMRSALYFTWSHQKKGGGEVGRFFFPSPAFLSVYICWGAWWEEASAIFGVIATAGWGTIYSILLHLWVMPAVAFLRGAEKKLTISSIKAVFRRTVPCLLRAVSFSRCFSLFSQGWRL
jgi:hypothetical protein